MSDNEIPDVLHARQYAVMMRLRLVRIKTEELIIELIMTGVNIVVNV